MIQIVWEISVQEDAQGQFELIFGPGGAWGKLFASAPGFRGTTLLSDTQNPCRFLILETWDSQAQRETALSQNAIAYAHLMEGFTAWAGSRTDLGVFRHRAEAGVRPSPSQKRRR